MLLVFHYLQYLLKAKGAHRIHSPFVFELYNKVLDDKNIYYDFQPIEMLRSQLLRSNEMIETVDFGAGNKNIYPKKMMNIAKRTSVSPKKGRLLFRLANYMQPKTLVEMGTSLGISTLYMAKAVPAAKIVTMEGNPYIAEKAAKNFSILKAKNIQLAIGKFEDTLPKVISAFSKTGDRGMLKVDFAFFDGNHRKEATLQYFKAFLPLASENCVFVFDDIRWSKDMFNAWQEIIKEPKAAISIDLFSFGLVFLNRDQPKEDFVIKF